MFDNLLFLLLFRRSLHYFQHIWHAFSHILGWSHEKWLISGLGNKELLALSVEITEKLLFGFGITSFQEHISLVS